MKGGAVLAVGILVVAVASGAAQDVSLSVSAGLFFPDHEAFRDIYGSGIPFSLDVWVGFSRAVGASIGVLYLGQKGTALIIEGPEEEHPLKFKMVSVPLSVFYRASFNRVVVRFGVGLGYHSYREAWKSIDIVHKGSDWAPVLYVTIERPVSGKASVFASLRYESIPTSSGSPVLGDVNVGGITAVAGILVRIH